jgi:sensor histidine kinase YesM
MEDEYGLEHIDGSPMKAMSQLPVEEYGAEEIIITESDISASQEYEHLNYHLEQENCNISNNSSQPQINNMFYIDVGKFEVKKKEKRSP